MRTYEKTHPWLKFSADFRHAPPPFWMTLGECQSKCEHIAGVPLQPETAQELYRVYLAKGVLATTAIEGNTLSEEEVLRHLDGKLELPPSRDYLRQEIVNIIEGCNAILEDVRLQHAPMISPRRIMDLHRTVLRKLTTEDDVVRGEIRTKSVGVARYRGAPAEDCEFLLARLCEWLNGDDFKPAPGQGIAFATLKAILAHLYLAWIHPFADGNGRTARLLEFQILIASGVPAPAAHLLSNHYNQTRTEYYRQLDAASRSGGEVIPFATYAIEGFLDGLRSQLQRIRTQQWDVAWDNFVHEAFKDKNSPGEKRRRDLVLDLSKQPEPLPLGKLTEISPRIAAAYARKTGKTLSRDLTALLQMNLLQRDNDGKYKARKEVILAFLPPRANAENPPAR
jgi:Fic family protein